MPRWGGRGSERMWGSGEETGVLRIPMVQYGSVDLGIGHQQDGTENINTKSAAKASPGTTPGRPFTPQRQKQHDNDEMRDHVHNNKKLWLNLT